MNTMTTAKVKKWFKKRGHLPNRRNGSVASHPFGQVGYRFTKNFPGYGKFDGVVVAIRPNAGTCIF